MAAAAFSAFDGVNSVFRVGGPVAAGVTNASEVSSLWISPTPL
jgi:hypothetical protein